MISRTVRDGFCSAEDMCDSIHGIVLESGHEVTCIALFFILIAVLAVLYMEEALDTIQAPKLTTIPKPIAPGGKENDRRVINLLWVPVPVGMYTNATGYPVRVNNTNAYVVFNSISPQSTDGMYFISNRSSTIVLNVDGQPVTGILYKMRREEVGGLKPVSVVSAFYTAANNVDDLRSGGAPLVVAPGNLAMVFRKPYPPRISVESLLSNNS